MHYFVAFIMLLGGGGIIKCVTVVTLLRFEGVQNNEKEVRNV